ncbi:unnamed protein product [Lactuca saligna]|uniref:SWIM-type domain-containing protein n=1 Tax=Lactuca saligna TaxID=75948 RepID=A0AA35YXT4_LACSI|nr:unnamed protein product [Lactuca saligna]
MVFVMWVIRPKGERYDITNEYERVPTMFTIKLHHGGNFTKLPNMKYVKGEVRYIDLVDIDEFSVHELDGMMLELGYFVPPVIYYHFRIPYEDLDFDLRALGNANDVLNLAKYIGDNKELCDVDLPKEGNVPQVQAKDKTPIIDEANDQTQLAGYMSWILFDRVPTQVSLEYRRNGRVNSIVDQSSYAKKLRLVELDDVVEDQGGDHAKLDDVVQDQGGENPKLDDVVQDQAGENANMDDENVEDHQFKHKKSADSDDLGKQSEEQYDELVDDENYVLEVEVDMTDFNLNLDKDDGCVQMDGFHNGVGTNDEHEDIEVIDNDRWNSLDEESEDERKRKCILKTLAEEKRYGLGNVHKASFYGGKKFKSKKILKEKIDMHALETRRNLYYKKNDKLRLQALCRGVVPIMDASGVVGLNTKNKRKGKERIMDQIDTNLGIPLRALQEKLQKDFEVGVSIEEVFRDKAIATKIVEGDYTKQDEILRDYILELQATNVDTTVNIDVYSEQNPSNPTRRYLLGFNGAHMKGPFPEQALTTVGLDSNNGRAISDILLNNLCEVFNINIIEGRDKPIIGCLEYIREYWMKRICNVMKVIDKAKGPLTPTATTILDVNKSHASNYIARWNGGEKYQVSGACQDQHVVDVRNTTCTYRKWELIGIPCKHAIATLYEMTKNSEDVGDIYRWVNKLYWLDTWKNTYSYKVEPIKGRIMWPKRLCPTTLIRPIHHKQPGRLTKKRKKAVKLVLMELKN